METFPWLIDESLRTAFSSNSGTMGDFRGEGARAKAPMRAKLCFAGGVFRGRGKVSGGGRHRLSHAYVYRLGESVSPRPFPGDFPRAWESRESLGKVSNSPLRTPTFRNCPNRNATISTRAHADARLRIYGVRATCRRCGLRRSRAGRTARGVLSGSSRQARYQRRSAPSQSGDKSRALHRRALRSGGCTSFAEVRFELRFFPAAAISAS